MVSFFILIPAVIVTSGSFRMQYHVVRSAELKLSTPPSLTGYVLAAQVVHRLLS